MSNPGDRWRRAWIVPVVLLVAALGLGLARCSSRDAVPGAQAFSSASVPESDAVFAIERPSDSRVLFLRGKVTSQTARDLREEAALIKASAAADEPQWEIDDSLTIAKDGIAIADPKGAMEAFLLVGAPSALRINSEYGAELTGTAPDAETATVFGDAVGAALGEGAIKNSLTVGAATDTETTAAPVETTPPTTVAETTTTEAPTTTVAAVETTAAAVETTVAATETTVAAVTETTLPAETTTTIAVADTTPITQEQEAAVVQSIELNGVTFASGSAQLTGNSNAILDQAAQVLTENPAVNVEIGGHTDDRGDANFNRTLSQRRADAVKAYLVAKGIAADRMTAKGYGPDQPVTSNATEAGRAQNRRIEFTPA